MITRNTKLDCLFFELLLQHSMLFNSIYFVAKEQNLISILIKCKYGLGLSVFNLMNMLAYTYRIRVNGYY